QERERVLGVLCLGRGDEDVDDREVAAVGAGKGDAVEILALVCAVGDELAEGRVVHGLESAPAGRELLGRLVPGQATRLGVGVAQDSAEVTEGGPHLLAAPVEAVVEHVLPAASSERAQQRVLKELD